MKKSIFLLICFLSIFPFIIQGSRNWFTDNEDSSQYDLQISNQEKPKYDLSISLTFENTNHELLNYAVLLIINQERKKRGVSAVREHKGLSNIAKVFQSKLEFRSFVKPLKIASKINKNLLLETKKCGYKGGLAKAIAGQHNAVNYEKGKPFFHLKGDTKNKLGLYYGQKKGLKKENVKLNKINTYTYREFAEEIVKNLTKNQKRTLFNSAYQEIGIQLNWYYKSLYKRKIPQIKMVAILGGYLTSDIR